VHGPISPPAFRICKGEGKKSVNQDLPSDGNGGAPKLQRGQGDVELLVAHLDAAYNLARYLMRNEAEAEDVVQSAYVRAISHFAGFRGGDGRAWLLAIVRNNCYDRMRKRGASGQDADFDEGVHSGGRQNPDPEAALLLSERTALVWKSLAALPAESREVLVLRELEELTYREIANIVGIPLGTVMSRLSRARERLQETLSGYLKRGETGATSLPGSRTTTDILPSTM
jgi:RNA polymerase sigma-70 factor (ECF subfamily)